MCEEKSVSEWKVAENSAVCCGKVLWKIFEL